VNEIIDACERNMATLWISAIGISFFVIIL